MWALWIVGGLVAWGVLAVGLGLVIGRGVRIADHPHRRPVVPATRPVPRVVARPRRRALPLPPVGVAMAAVAVVLETAGFLLRLTGVEGPVRRLLSMDAPLSVPRLYVAALFAAAAATAIVGAGSQPSRRTWWTAVGVVAALIASVKAGGTIHAAALGALTRRIGAAPAVAVSVLLVGVVVAALWWLSRSERRDRRRVLGSLVLYAVAAVGLSAVSSFVSAHSGSFALTAAATYVEESGEALSGVAFLIGVLVGVAPRLVLPAAWPLRRDADSHTVDAGTVPATPVVGGSGGRG